MLEIVLAEQAYVDNTTLMVREDLVGFFECDAILVMMRFWDSGNDIATKIILPLKSLKSRVHEFTGSHTMGSHDGAGSVKGTDRAQIRKN